MIFGSFARGPTLVSYRTNQYKLDVGPSRSESSRPYRKDSRTPSKQQEIAYQVAGFYLQTGSRKPLDLKPLNKDLTEDDRYRLELQVFGFPISVHPLARYRPLLSSRIKYARDIPHNIGRSIYLIGVCITRKESRTRKSEPMEFLTLEDESDTYECVLFPNAFKEFGDLLHWETLFIIRGTIEESY